MLTIELKLSQKFSNSSINPVKSAKTYNKINTFFTNLSKNIKNHHILFKKLVQKNPFLTKPLTLAKGEEGRKAGGVRVIRGWRTGRWSGFEKRQVRRVMPVGRRGRGEFGEMDVTSPTAAGTGGAAASGHTPAAPTVHFGGEGVVGVVGVVVVVG